MEGLAGVLDKGALEDGAALGAGKAAAVEAGAHGGERVGRALAAAGTGFALVKSGAVETHGTAAVLGNVGGEGDATARAGETGTVVGKAEDLDRVGGRHVLGAARAGGKT